MTEYEASTYGEHCADVYDSWYSDCDEAVVTTLAELAADGPILELGIGTGRIALPLASRGLHIQGIDASPSMVAKMRAKAGGKSIPVTFGNFADIDIESKFSLIFVVFNTFFGLLTQEEQVRCFRSVARHLTEDGVFLMEAFVPDLTRFRNDQNVQASSVTADGLQFDITRHDPVLQQLIGQHLVITNAGFKLYPVQLRYAWPTELDLMAQLAGLRLRQRWNGWLREPFNSRSGKHVSVYEKVSGH
ncbi:MAG TPA: class I SAM-dependent methyltransferase [Abditibacteriaceae bacterium]|nr:class I SAM-dependent methyltransferase [Abditibacteriaceae bacterium]